MILAKCSFINNQSYFGSLLILNGNIGLSFSECLFCDSDVMLILFIEKLNKPIKNASEFIE